MITTSNLQPGDIAACYGVDLISRFISWKTVDVLAPAHLKLGPSHVAIFCSYRDEPLWVESTTFCRQPCYLKGERVSGVQAHLPEDRIEDYVAAGGRIDLYRLTTMNQLTGQESALLNRVLIQSCVRSGIHYDISGALLSGTRFLSFSGLFPGADLSRLFCSELVAAALMRLALLNRGNPARLNPGRLLRILIRTGVYERVGTLGLDGSS